MDSMRLESLKNKGEHAQSAIASQEVREHLAGFIRSKRGSSTQINAINSNTKQRNHSQAISETNGNNINRSQDDGRDQEAQRDGGGGHHFNQHHKNDDHPLRKTASMPTMHIPYKAQSLSRRRQMERRTTMSPLMKRKSRPRRPLLHSLDANEYSSNPCIIQGSSSVNQRSLSQSNSPPPPLSMGAQAAHQLSGSNGGELFRIDHTASGMLAHDHHELFESSSNTTSLDSGGGEGDLKESLRQQHMRVQEAIRKTIISRASSRNKMVVTGGSLDSEMSTSRFDPSLLLATQNSSELGSGQAAATTTTKLPGGHFLPLGNHARNRDELRQWSLDGADLRASFNAQKAAAAAAAAAANRTLAYGLFHRLKLGTTNSAAALRRSQSPVSSISMGLPSSGSSTSTSGSQTATSSAATILSSQPTTTQQQQQQVASAAVTLTQNQVQFRPKMETPRLSQQTARMKLYSSSSSSTSSLFSGQDSLEDSSQAIDLSSSSEASRHKKQQQQQQHLSTAPSLFTRQQNQLNSNQRQNYHTKLLQESFGQLQLCPELKPIVPMPAQHFVVAAQLADQLQQQQQHPILDQTNSDKTPSFDATSHREPLLDGVGGGDSLQGEFIASLAHQFNLSTSAQNLISSQECQQQQHLNSILVHQQQQHEFNQWLAAHNNLVQSSEFQPANEITSSLLAKILSLPEPYKSTLFAQMLQQQQLHQHQQQQDSMHLPEMNRPPPNQTTAAATTTTTTTTFINQTQPTFQSQDQNQDRKSIIARALSSPMLVASGTGKGSSTTLAAFDGNSSEEPMQTVDLVASNPHHSDHLFGGGHHFDVQMANDDDDGEGHANGAGRNLFGQPNLTSLDLSVASQRSKRSEKAPEPIDQQQRRRLAADEHATGFGQSANVTSLSTSSNLAKLATNLQGQVSSSFTSTPFGAGGGSSSEINCNFLYNPVFDQSSRTGLVYELELCNHKCICQNEINHPENSFRILAIWRRLHDTGLMAKCARIGARRAALSELQLCHGETYANYFGRTPYERFKLRQLDLSKLPIEGLTQLECGGQGADIDTAWNEEQTPGVARLAVGCAIEAAVRVATGKLLNAFAVVRPPGHHAEHQQAMGFCFFNSVAIVARVLIERHRLERVLIVDWDVHHGNGIQKMFYNDPKVMYISLHRHDRGNFFPGTGDLKELGAGGGLGYNLNVAWSGEAMGDAEYLAAFRALVMPIARDFNPSQVLVACGFDGAAGHPFNFGGYELSAACFGYMTQQLMQLASGRLVLCLEGGYQLEAICDCAQACLQSLLRNEPAAASGQKTADELQMISQRELEREPNRSAREVLHELANLAAEHWPSVARRRHLIDVSALEAATSKTM